MKLVYGVGRAQVEFSDAQRAAFEAVLDAVAPNTVAAIDAETKRVMDAAVKDAPYKTRKFQRSFERGIRIQGGTIVGFVRNTDPKAYHVRWGVKAFGRRLGGRVVEDLVFKPGRKGIDKVAAALADDLAAAAARGR